MACFSPSLVHIALSIPWQSYRVPLCLREAAALSFQQAGHLKEGREETTNSVLIPVSLHAFVGWIREREREREKQGKRCLAPLVHLRGLGSVRSETTDKRTLEMVSAGLQLSLSTSRQIAPELFTLQ